MKNSEKQMEVMIGFNKKDSAAMVYTTDPVWMEKVDELVKEFPDLCAVIHKTQKRGMYEVPKRFLCIGTPLMDDLASEAGADRENLKAAIREATRRIALAENEPVCNESD